MKKNNILSVSLDMKTGEVSFDFIDRLDCKNVDRMMRENKILKRYDEESKKLVSKMLEDAVDFPYDMSLVMPILHLYIINFSNYAELDKIKESIESLWYYHFKACTSKNNKLDRLMCFTIQDGVTKCKTVEKQDSVDTIVPIICDTMTDDIIDSIVNLYYKKLMSDGDYYIQRTHEIGYFSDWTYDSCSKLTSKLNECRIIVEMIKELEKTIDNIDEYKTKLDSSLIDAINLQKRHIYLDNDDKSTNVEISEDSELNEILNTVVNTYNYYKNKANSLYE